MRILLEVAGVDVISAAMVGAIIWATTKVKQVQGGGTFDD